MARDRSGGAPRGADGRALIYARDPNVVGWVEHELFGEAMSASVAASIAEVVSTLTVAPPPRAQVLIVHVAALKPHETTMLAAIRDAGWGGMVIALGDASDELRRALDIDRVLPLPLRAESLRGIVRAGSDRPTTPIRRIER